MIMKWSWNLDFSSETDIISHEVSCTPRKFTWALSTWYYKTNTVAERMKEAFKNEWGNVRYQHIYSSFTIKIFTLDKAFIFHEQSSATLTLVFSPCIFQTLLFLINVKWRLNSLPQYQLCTQFSWVLKYWRWSLIILITCEHTYVLMWE